MQNCKVTGKNFIVSEFEKDFLKKVSPVIHGKKFEFPLPELCPDERLRLRTIQRNEQNLHRVKSALTGKPLISLYSDDSYKIYDHDEWLEMDGMAYGRNYDFTKGFFEQFHELNLAVPRVNLVQVGNENCPYTTGTGYCRNCHMINCSENCEDCMYGKLLQGCRDCVDSSFAYDSEILYQCFSVKDSYNCVGLSYSQNCSDCLFSENLKGCRNCFLCTNLSNKEYYFMNKPVDKEYYEKVVKDFLGSYAKYQKAYMMLEEMRKTRIHKYANIVNCEGCTGDFLVNSKNCVNCFDVNDSEDCMYVNVGVNVKDLLDCSNMYLKPELNYQVLGTIGTYNVHFGVYVFNSKDVMYSQFCYDSEHLFGCVGLRKKQFCIFNKQYSREEYFDLLPRIISAMMERGEWGQFFPASTSPFPYNNTVANDYLPLSKEEAVARGYRWLEETETLEGEKVEDLADNIKDIDDSIIDKVLVCNKSGKKYKILKKELEFLRRMRLPVPRICPDERHKMRMAMRNPVKLYERTCMKTGESLMSPYPAESPIKIYSERAYLEEVF